MEENDTIEEIPSTPPSSGKMKPPMTTGTRVFQRLTKALEAVEKPDFASVLYEEDLTFNTSTATAVGGGMNMTLLGETEDISRVVGVLDAERLDGVEGNDTLLHDGDFSFQLERPQVSVRPMKEALQVSVPGKKEEQKVSARGIKREMDFDVPSAVKRPKKAGAEYSAPSSVKPPKVPLAEYDAPSSVKSKKVAGPAYDAPCSVQRPKVTGADSGVMATPAVILKSADSFVCTPPTSKRKKPIAVLTEMKLTARKTTIRKSSRMRSLASTPGVKMRLLAKSANSSFGDEKASWTVSKVARQPRIHQSVKKPEFGQGVLKMEDEEVDDVSPKTARRVVKSVTKTLSLSLRVSSTASIDVEKFWRELKADGAFSNLKRKRFDGIIANLHDRNRCFVSDNVIHRI